jgi:hypothetical protein
VDRATVNRKLIGVLQAQCLFFKGEYESARGTLEPFWAFFQDDAESQSKYDSLMVAITAKIQKPDAQ